MSTQRALITTVLLAFASLNTQAKPQTYTLTDPVTDAPLANTPYFMNVQNGKFQEASKYTDSQGRTHASEKEPIVLVQAEGSGKQLFITNLNTRETPELKLKGAPYLVFNKNNNQTLCANVNENGFTHAYYMDNAQSWYDNGFIFQLQPKQTCASARNTAHQFLNSDTAGFLEAYDHLDQTFVMSDDKKKSFLYSQIDQVIKDKEISLKSAEKKLIQRGVELAIADKEDSRLNSIGYSLGFDRQEYKRGLELLGEALKLNPKDCYASNSKGYLLMRSGDVKQAQKYFFDADQACIAASKERKAGNDADYGYPLSVNYAHLAESYAILKNERLSNEFFNRALRIGSIKAKDEILEVSKNLIGKKTLTQDNINLLKTYIQYIQNPGLQAAPPTPK